MTGNNQLKIQALKIIPLMENNLCGEGIVAEHGLSLYIETEKHRIIADTGQSARTWDNAMKRGVDLETVDIVFLSHGHYDHSGGIMSFADINPSASIFMKDTAGDEYYTVKETGMKYIGIDKSVMHLPGIRLLGGDFRLDSEISVFSGVKGRRLWPKGNLKLRVMRKAVQNNNIERHGSGEEKPYVSARDVFVQDQLLHEQYLVIETNGKYVLVSGCAHAGILNILDRFREIYGQDPDYVFSGFHMMQDQYTKNDLNDIRETARELSGMDTVFYTGHCTGETAFRVMKEIMGEQIRGIWEI